MKHQRIIIQDKLPHKDVLCSMIASLLNHQLHPLYTFTVQSSSLAVCGRTRHLVFPYENFTLTISSWGWIHTGCCYQWKLSCCIYTQNNSRVSVELLDQRTSLYTGWIHSINASNCKYRHRINRKATDFVLLAYAIYTLNYLLIRWLPTCVGLGGRLWMHLRDNTFHWHDPWILSHNVTVYRRAVRRAPTFWSGCLKCLLEDSTRLARTEIDRHVIDVSTITS